MVHARQMSAWRTLVVCCVSRLFRGWCRAHEFSAPPDAVASGHPTPRVSDTLLFLHENRPPGDKGTEIPRLSSPPGN